MRLHLYFLILLISPLGCRLDRDEATADVGRTVDTGRPDAGAPDVAPNDALRPDAHLDAHLDALLDPGIDASSPPLPPGCEATLDSLETTGAYCWWQDGDPGPDAFNEPFVGRAIVESVVENGLDRPVFPGTRPFIVDYRLQFDDGFPVRCAALGTRLPWAQGDEVWLETDQLGQFINLQTARISGSFRHGAPDAPFDVLIATNRADTSLTDTRIDLAKFGLTLTLEAVCPPVPWPEFGVEDEFHPERTVFGRELALFFANGAGDTLTLRRGEQGEIGLPDGRRARIVLTMAREYQPDPNNPYVGLYHSFLLTIAP